MWERWNNHEWIVSMGSKWSMWGGMCWTLGIIFALIGIIGDAANTNPGLAPISWFLLAVAAFVSSIAWYIGWAVAVYIDVLKNKKQQ
ncbi:MAG TPA: hypothetical protein G4O10_10500 [Dehalococcoidia bacterium]|nr:hypothetical protein [Dehalococcoidia bacterium]